MSTNRPLWESSAHDVAAGTTSTWLAATTGAAAARGLRVAISPTDGTPTDGTPTNAVDGPRGPSSELRPRAGGEGRVAAARRLAARPGGIEALDRLTELAARLLGATSGQVSVIGDEQVVMGGSGAASASVGQHSPAADSLCTVTVGADVPVAIENTAADPRVAGLPPVASGAVGAYLGVPLRSGPHVVGALCVFAPGPRPWTPADVEMLEDLAGSAMAELELAALEISHEAVRRAWQLAVDAAGVGAWDLDLETGALRWDDRLLKLYGLDRSTFDGTVEVFTRAIHPDDRDRVLGALRLAVTEVSTFEVEYRVVWPDETVHWIAARGQAVPGADGPTRYVLGAAQNSTVVQESEARARRALEAMPDGFFHLDHEWRFTYANPEAVRLLGPTTPDPTGQVIWEAFPPLVGTVFEERYRAAVESGLPTTVEAAYYPPPLDAWFEVKCWPTPDGLSLYILDITERHRAQEVLEAVGRREAMLAEVTTALTATPDVDEAVTRFAQLMVPELADWCVITLVDGTTRTGTGLVDGWHHRLSDLGWWHRDPTKHGLVDRWARLRLAALTDDSLTAAALLTHDTAVLRQADVETSAAVLAPGAARDLWRLLAPESAAVIPLRGRGRVAGLLSVFRGADREPFDPEELELLADAASRAGLALDHAPAYADRRDLVEDLQRTLLTRPHEHDHLEVAVRYEGAAETARIGGDWYDAFARSDGAMTLVIGGVIGHGTAAAAAMGQVRGLVRGIATTTGESPADVLTRVDEAVSLLQIDTLATAVVARLEADPDAHTPGSLRLRWSNAAHPPPVVVLPAGSDPAEPDADAAVRWLRTERTDPMIGLPDAGDQGPRDESVASLPPEATVLLYTDGLLQRRGSTLDEGFDRLRDVLVDLAPWGLSPDRLCDEVLTRMLPERTEDDVALLAVRGRPLQGGDAEDPVPDRDRLPRDRRER